ncbi:unnamed protein product, partial [marine sediment metagenome]
SYSITNDQILGDILGIHAYKLFEFTSNVILFVSTCFWFISSF